MLDPFTTWSRLIAVGAEMARTNLRAFETIASAHDVVAARGEIISAALRSPLTADHRELSRMVPEKLDAFSRAGSATLASWTSAQAAWFDQMQQLGGMALRGRPPTYGELAASGERIAQLTLASIEAAAKLGSSAIAPLHQTATANAKRLGRTAGRKTR